MTKLLTITPLLIVLLVGCNLLRSRPPVEITATQLEREYKENPSAADEKYERRTLIVTGNISHYAELRGTIGVYLERSSSTSEWWIMCLIDKSSHPDAYSKLKQKQHVTFRGTSRRESDSNFISLIDCEIK